MKLFKKKEPQPPKIDLPTTEEERIEYIRQLKAQGENVNVAFVQRLFQIGYSKAARIVDFANGLDPDEIARQRLENSDEDDEWEDDE